MAIPPQYQRRGVPPAKVFIDELMNYAGKSYYVGLLSEASMFGAAHHAPQEFQILTPDQMKDIHIKRLRIFSKGKSICRVSNLSSELKG